MAADTAATFPLAAAAATIALPKASVKVSGFGEPFTIPVLTSNGSAPWKWPGWSSAGGYPFPFFVTMCRKTGSSMERSVRSIWSSS